MLHKIGEVVLSTLLDRLQTDDTQAYIRTDCKRGTPVSALGTHVGGNGLWKKQILTTAQTSRRVKFIELALAENIISYFFKNIYCLYARRQTHKA